jgi:spore germination cell wall hydrolase CwlJ-like protein
MARRVVCIVLAFLLWLPVAVAAESHSDLDDIPIPAYPLTSDELGLFTKVVCAESRGQTRGERRAVIHVVLNRVNRPTWWGNSVISVLLAKSQFAKPSDPMCQDEFPPPPAGVERWSPYLVELNRRIIQEIREDIVASAAGQIPDPTNGAVYFHARRLGTVWPRLSEVRVPSNWTHRFFRD